MKIIFVVAASVFLNYSSAQINPEQYGFKHVKILFKGDSVDILIKRKKGEEEKRKPVLLFCQGSLPQPLLKFHEQQLIPVFPFMTDILESGYHLAIVGKPFVPLSADIKDLDQNFSFSDSETGAAPVKYSARNHLDYYVQRNKKVVAYLCRLPYVRDDIFVLAGHSEGSTIAAKLASQSKKITHLIYASGNPLGRIMSIIEKARRTESNTDSTRYAEQQFLYWEKVVQNKNASISPIGDSPKTTFDFSIPPIQYLKKLTIPVLVCYGTRDFSVTPNDHLRIEMIRTRKSNFTFKSYIGLDHNYFLLNEKGSPDYDQYFWNNVASDWLHWLRDKVLIFQAAR